TEVREKDPVDATYDFTAYDGTVVKWVFKTSLEKKYGIRYPIKNAKCPIYSDKMLSKPENGGLGKSYCVVDGTGGDFIGGDNNAKGIERMSGGGAVLVMGSTEEPWMTKEEKGEGKGYLKYIARLKWGA
ncbi:hypothetical protein CC86DRAFT_281745, partial [Ophiobolus disseminans]